MSQLIASTYIRKLWITLDSKNITQTSVTAPSSSRNSDPIPSGRLAMEIATMETTNVPATKRKRKAGNLCSRPIFIVPVHADPPAHFFCCPPGQQVLELQWRPHITNPVKCSDEMENGFTVHVLGHVVQSSPDLVLVLFIECRRVCVVNQLTKCAT